MKQSEVQQELERFKKSVIKEARKNLTTLKKNHTKSLWNSLQGSVKVMPNSFYVEFEMDLYGRFQDKGVKGKDPSKVSANARITGQQAPNSPYKFGSGSASGKWGEFVSKIEKWAQNKNIRLRDDKGKFKKGSYKTIAQIIAGNIYNRGIKPSLFFTTPFEAAYNRLPDELIEKFGLDASELFMYTQFKNEKK